MYVIPIGNVSTGGHANMHLYVIPFRNGVYIVYVIWLQVDNYVCDMYVICVCDMVTGSFISLLWGARTHELPVVHVYLRVVKEI